MNCSFSKSNSISITTVTFALFFLHLQSVNVSLHCGIFSLYVLPIFSVILTTETLQVQELISNIAKPRKKSNCTVEVVSAAGASLPNADTVSFTEGVDVWRREEEKDEDEKEEEEPSTNRHTVQTAQIYLFF